MTNRRILRTIVIVGMLIVGAGLLGLTWAIYCGQLNLALYAPYLNATKEFWENTKEFLNSVFFTSIIGALAGAFAGAYGGQRIVERGKVREQLLAEIRNTNAAIMIAFSVCNSLLSLKGQHLKHLKKTYDEQRLEVTSRLEMLKTGAGKPDTQFKFLADFQTLFLPLLPLDVLQTQIFEKLSPTGQVILLTTTLRGTIHSLGSSIQLRNKIIEGFKSRAPEQQDKLITLYFGIPDGGGHVNEEYPAALKAICDQTDDGIFFSNQICVQLVRHGTSIVERFTSRFGKGAPTVTKPDFAKARANDLMPSDDKYADWVSMFNQRSPSQTSN